MKSLRDIDLNLLVVFHEILRQGSISAAAAALDMSQPAASNALTRLRAHFDDPLFVRTRRGMQPTPVATRLARPIGDALAVLQNGLTPREDFDPAGSPRTFTLAMTDVAELHFMPSLATHCATVAPHVRLATVRASGSRLLTGLEAGHIDLAIGAHDDIPDGFFQQRLFWQDCVTLHRADHPFARAAPDLDAFRAADHLLITEAASPYDQIRQRLERAGLRGARVHVPSLLTAPMIVARTDLVATVPRRLAEQLAPPLGLGFITPPVRLPRLVTSTFWHRRFHQDAGHRWLRAAISAMFSN